MAHHKATDQKSPLDNHLPYPADELCGDLYHCIADAEAMLIRVKMHWRGKDKDITQLNVIGAALLKASIATRKLEWPNYDSPDM